MHRQKLDRCGRPASVHVRRVRGHAAGHFASMAPWQGARRPAVCRLGAQRIPYAGGLPLWPPARAVAATPRRQMHARPTHRAPDSAAHPRPRWGRDGGGARMHGCRPLCSRAAARLGEPRLRRAAGRGSRLAGKDRRPRPLPCLGAVRHRSHGGALQGERSEWGAEIPGGAGGEKNRGDRRRAAKMRADDPTS